MDSSRASGTVPARGDIGAHLNPRERSEARGVAPRVSLATAERSYMVVSSARAAGRPPTSLESATWATQAVAQRLPFRPLCPGSFSRGRTKGGTVMSGGIRRPVLVLSILLAAVGYAATKEWEWQADAD